MCMHLLLGVDVGTTSVKGTVLNSEDKIVATGFITLPQIVVRGNEAEANANDWWMAFNRLLKDLSKTFRLEEISHLCVGGQGPTVVPINKEGRPLSNSLIWMDRRATVEADLISKATGDNVDAYLFESKVLWLKHHAGEIYNETFKFLSAYDFIAYKLTGKASTGVLRANYTPWWSIPYWSPEHLKAVGVDLGKMADPVEVGDVLGQIGVRASEETGLNETTTVVQGVTDFAHDILGAGVSRTGRALDHGGTSQGFDLCWPSDLPDSKGRVLSTPHIVPSLWNISGLMSTTGALLRWFRDNFSTTEIAEASSQGKDPYDLMAALASTVEPGSDKLLILPYFAGERSPIWDTTARGVIFGLTLAHRREHIVRALMESVAYAVRHVMGTITDLGGKVDEVRSVGGQSRSDLWNQIKCDVLGLPIVTVAYESTESLGTAITAGFGAGVFKSLAEGSDRVVKVKNRFEPDPANHAKYDGYFELYRKLYNSLKDRFGEMEALMK